MGSVEIGNSTTENDRKTTENDRKITENAEYLKESRKRKKEQENQLLTIAGISIEKLLDLAKEFLRASNSNPIIGMASTLLITDILYRAKIIDLTTAVGINILVGTVEGSSIAGQILGDITDLFQFFGNRPSNIEFKPSAQTIVYAENSGDSGVLKSLLTREGVKG
ncbi:MAG: hypothetical protein QW478_10160 [Candidatus Micrarchaeaceae archaeon]